MPLTKVVNGIQVPLDPAEESAVTSIWSDWESNVKPVIQRKRAFEEAKKQALSFDEDEIDILLAGYMETKLVRLAVALGQAPNTVETPVINAINAVFPGQTKLQVAQTIENRAQGYLTSAATALANKIKDGG